MQSMLTTANTMKIASLNVRTYGRQLTRSSSSEQYKSPKVTTPIAEKAYETQPIAVKPRKRPSTILSTRKSSPPSPGIRANTMQSNSRSFASSVMQLNISNQINSVVPGMVVPEVTPNFEKRDNTDRFKLETQSRHGDYQFWNEPKMVVRSVLDHSDNGNFHIDVEETKVLDFGVSCGAIGELFANLGFKQVYGQEGSEQKRARQLKKGHYKEIESFIVGKQALPSHYRRQFDIVSSSGNLGVGRMPSEGLTEMVKALRKGGIAVFSIDEKLLDPETDKGTGYSRAIKKLTEEGAWAPRDDIEFVNKTKSKGQRSRVMIFEKL